MEENREQGTVRSHMRTIYIKLGLYGYPISARRLKTFEDFCRLLHDPEYLNTLDGDVIDSDRDQISGEGDQADKGVVIIEPDEERDEEIDDMIDEDGDNWLMRFQSVPVEVIPVPEIPEPDLPPRRINIFRIIVFVFALIGFITAVIFVYELIKGEPTVIAPIEQESIENTRESVVIMPTAIPTIIQIQPTETVFIPTESPTTAPTAPPKPAILFEDNFDAGLSEAWEVISGNPIVVNGMLSSDQDTWLVVGDPSWTNYSVEFKANSKYIYYFWGANIVAVRLVNIENMYAYEWVDSESRWHIVENGSWNKVPQSGFRPGYDDFLEFKITVIDNLITIYVDGLKKASFFDDRFSQGRVGLKITEETLIDDFIVCEILD